MKENDIILTGYELLIRGAAGENPSDVLLDMEHRGHAQAVARKQLPIKSPWNELEKLGFKRAEDRDKLDPHAVLIAATFPEGWTLVKTDHSMWSHLKDPQGRIRASMFYKSAFYDTDAYLSLVPRYKSQVQPKGGWNVDYDRDTHPFEAVILDGETVIGTYGEIVRSDYKHHDVREGNRAFYQAKDALEDHARAKLKEQFPDHENPLAYWD